MSSTAISVLRTFYRPLPKTAKVIVSSGWSQPRPHHASGPDIHRALDLPAAKGTPIYAMADGVVSKYNPTDNGDAGIWMQITHAGGVVTRYMHMSQIANLPAGSRVRRGQEIGKVGQTGDAAITHLHVDVAVPAETLPDLARVVGLPKTPPVLQAGLGYRIPAEPWVPVDGYNSRTSGQAKTEGVPFYRPPGILSAQGAGGFALGVGIGLGVLFLMGQL